jgi:hypothetical protein
MHFHATATCQGSIGTAPGKYCQYTNMLLLQVAHSTTIGRGALLSMSSRQLTFRVFFIALLYLLRFR